MHRKLTSLLATLLLAAVVLQGCGASTQTASPATSASTSAAPASPVTIGLWHNYGIESNATATDNLVKAYMAAHPNVTIDVVSQPATNYFDLLQAAAISKTGPCLATQWTGLYALKYKSYLEKLNPTYMSTETLKQFKGVEWASENFDPEQGVYVVPLEMQFFNGFYNKELFAKAGITSLPTTWAELDAANKKLKAAGIQPFVYGTGGQAQQAGFNPIYDLSYLMMAFPLEDWKKLYTGEIPWTDPAIVAQLDKWVALRTDGYTNQDTLTNTESWQQFLTGKAAMTLEGTWSIAAAEEALGDKVGVFLPPFVDQPLKGVIEMAGDGFSMTTYCPNKDVAADFLKFLATPEAQKIIEDAGLIPGMQGFTSNDPLAVELLSYGKDKGYTRYPMLDGVVQTEVVDTFIKTLNAAFAGTMSTKDALQAMQDTLMALPADRRSPTYK
jgi:ABC-type glycerol-3-phosphate transport system substrate-binding protein